MTSDDQSLTGLKAAYAAVYHRSLAGRVQELVTAYGLEKVNDVCTELNPDNSVPCHWKITELATVFEIGN
jgi:hypothetical protein